MKRVVQVLVLALFCVSAIPAQIQMTVQELADFIRSEQALKQHKDKQIAAYIRNVELTEKLTEKSILDLKSQGAGPKTVQALEELQRRTVAVKESAQDATSSPAAAPPSTNASKAAIQANASPEPPPDATRQQQIIDLMRQYGISYTQDLPNFICIEVMRRYFRGLLAFRDHYRNIGTVLSKVSYNDGQENYRIYSINGRYGESTLEGAARNKGAISQGEFGSIMRDIFEPKSEGQFGWDHWAVLRDRKLAVFHFIVDKEHSGYSIAYSSVTGEDRQITTAFQGLIYADEQTGQIFRIKHAAAQIPKDFPISAVEEVVDYDTVEIAGKTYVLPLMAKLYMSAGRVKSRNEIEFRNYRKFDSETFVTYSTSDIAPIDVPPPFPASKTEERPWWAPPPAIPPSWATKPPD